MKDLRVTDYRQRCILLLFAFSLACSPSSSPREAPHGGDVTRRVVREGATDSRLPRGCDILRGAHKLLGAQATKEVPTSFILCQLPKAWRSLAQASRVGEEAEYQIPGKQVPAEIATLLGVPPGRDIQFLFRLDSIEDPPDGLAFPSPSMLLAATQIHSSGMRYVLHKTSGEDAPNA